MRAIYALLTDARVDEPAFQRWQERLRKEAPEYRRHSLDAKVIIAANRRFTDADPRFAPIEPEQVMRISLDAAQGWLNRILTTSPMEVAIVGDFDVEKAIAYAKKYLGSVGTRPVTVDGLQALRRLRVVSGPYEETVTAETDTPRTDIYLAWRGADWKDAHDRDVLDLASRVLDRRLMNELRAKRGWVYSVGCVSYPARYYLGNSRFAVLFSTAPDRSQEGLRLARHIVEKLAATGPTEDELAIVRRQLANEDEVSKRKIFYWQSWLAGMKLRGDDLGGLKEREATYQRATMGEVRDVLKRYIMPEGRVAIVGMPRVGGLKAATAGAQVAESAK